MTIGEHFKRTRTLKRRLELVAFVCSVVLIFAEHRLTALERNVWGIVGAVAIVWATVMLFTRKLRCPRCGTDFKSPRSEKVGRWSRDRRGPEELWDACPACGVSFNEPYGL
jgi:hypothetical protein